MGHPMALDDDDIDRIEKGSFDRVLVYQIE